MALGVYKPDQGYWTRLMSTIAIGVIALAGIAVNNSIILLEYLNDLKKEGLALEHALVEAGATRFRPIMLTTVTTMLGSLTIASDPVWAGLLTRALAEVSIAEPPEALAEVAPWVGAGPAERGAALRELLDTYGRIAASRPARRRRPPERFPRFASVKRAG